ncbi:inorganic phosphate transporter [Amnibacterium kyonggiense]|uniref:Phosphate transporter n=1 Tax=Amnibacterium kyonggiense TaxID=595671 RepID=A0A4R7FR25_9MICO|nr:inorganic phosphate transporter [Amnibacterium kyonggiense]TDS80223.1 PiT family inorganic phosphate transporter [Amnibacterium kyonggiense]
MDATLLITVVLVVVFALVFDFTNGFHDTANAMATSVATGALKPRTAVVIAGVLNLVGAFLSTEVAKTISSGIIRTDSSGHEMITPALIFAGLVGAIIWNLVTWYFGLPSSSSHALFGGLIGAAILGGGVGAISWSGVVTSIVIPAVLAPIVAGIAALIGTVIVYRMTKQASVPHAKPAFRVAQTVSASLVALAHGTSDAQKTMGVITLTLIAANAQPANTGPQFWVILTCGLAIGLGTAIGGFRIMKTVGTRITPVESPQGFAAESASAATILASSHLGFPLSTTQVVSGSIVGVGLGKRLSEVHWNVAGRIGLGWVFTLPAAAVVGAVAAWVAISSTAGLVIVAIAAVVGVAVIFRLAGRKPVTARNVNEGAPDAAPQTQGALA